MITVRDRSEDAPKSFTDETSPRQLGKSHRKVSIHGQVISEDGIAWFHELMKLYPRVSPETKSIQILEDFHTLPRDVQERIWRGMKKARINVVDSLPYLASFRKILERHFKADRLWQMLGADAARDDEVAKLIKNHLDEAVATSVIRNSSPHRLKQMLEPRFPRGSFGYYMRDNAPVQIDTVDLEPFKAKKKSVTAMAVNAASKAGSVFHPAIDEVDPVMMYLNEEWGHFLVKKKLRDCHAFDEGDDRSRRWIDDQRREIGSDHNIPFGVPDYVYDLGEFGDLLPVKSHESHFAQAADIAAGFARQAYERDGIQAVAKKFEYVTINGERITENNAEERFEFWIKLTEQERKRLMR